MQVRACPVVRSRLAIGHCLLYTFSTKGSLRWDQPGRLAVMGESDA